VGYFGFGSLVNPATLRTAYLDQLPAELAGYRRHWQARTKTLEQQIALLSVHQHPDTSIKGMLVIDHRDNLAAVDEREAGYRRHRLAPEELIVDTATQLPEELYVYIAHEPEGVADTGALLQSYLDAVMQGFYRGLIGDRSQPRYPRSVELSDHEQRLFDELLQPLVLGE